MSSFKTDNKKLHPGFVLIGENGLPVDTVSTISGTYPIIQDVSDSVTYNAGVVTVPVGVDLSVLKSHQPRYTGRFVFQDASQRLYFIDKLTINPISRTFVINPIEDVNSIAPSINLSAGWFIAEASLMNKLSTTTSAKIDQVEFRDMQFNMSLEGEKIVIKGTNGNTLEPTPNGGVKVEGEITVGGASLPNTTIITLGASGVYTEIVLPDTAKRFMVKAENIAKLKVHYGSPSNAFTVPYGCSYSEDNLKLEFDLSLFVSCTKPNQQIQVVYWE